MQAMLNEIPSMFSVASKFHCFFSNFYDSLERNIGTQPCGLSKISFGETGITDRKR